MAEFPALPLFTDAYISDTAHLTNEEHGVYLRLLMFAWRTPNCALPDNDARLALMVGVTKGKWAKLKPVIMSFWTLSENGYVQKKLTSQRAFVSKQREQKSIAGKASAKAKRLKSLYTGSTAVDEPLPTAGQQPITKPITTVKRDTKVSPKKPPVKSLVFDILSKVASADAVNGFIEMRWNIKAPMTERSAKLIADKLQGRIDADAILDLSTENNWKTVYPDSKQLNGGYNANGNHHNGTPQSSKRPDPALEQIARLTGIGRA